MNRLKIFPFKSILIFFIQGICFGAYVQKLPNVQTGSLRAPSAIKIDGKANEWGDKFQAFNTATDVFYTLSNDDDHLYLTIRAVDHDIINRIIKGGITLTVNTSGKRDEKNGESITYPIFTLNQVVINFESNQGDSFMEVNNKLLLEKSKYIMVSGIEGLDTVISINNKSGIIAAQAFDNKMAYTYELAVDLQLLGLSANNPQKFAYNIKVNGRNMVAINNKTINKDYNAGKSTFSWNSDPSVDAATDVWAEYVLAKN